jgi:hypothetical protein
MPDESADLLGVAQNVGHPGRGTCGTNCHFSGGMNDPLSHGRMNPNLLNPTRDQDVHMGTDGIRINCQACHTSRAHRISGRSISTPSVEGTFSCNTCHTDSPHIASSLLSPHLNRHSDHVACQTCHIPVYSKGTKTLTRWDWSKTEEADIQEQRLENGEDINLDKRYGELHWKENIKPEFRWYNGTVKRYLIGDPLENEITELNRPIGNINDQASRIFPFEVITGRQISDTMYKILIPAKLHEGYWEHGDWDKAAEQGMKLAGMPYGGAYDFVETIFFHGLNHEVLPKEQALSCVNCHTSLRAQESCLKCHISQEGPDLDKLANQGIDFLKYGKVVPVNDYIDFKALGYQGDPIETGGRFKRLRLSTGDDKTEQESFLRIEESVKEEGP